MAEHTAISWADHTFNPWIGCARVSPACDGCYADVLMGMDGRMKRAEWGGPGKGVGTRERTAPANWRKPLAWDRAAEAAGTRPFVFCASLADVFDNAVPVEWRSDLFDLVNATPHLTWLLLTKRPQNIVRLYEQACGLLEDVGFPSNAAIGCTVVTQQEADRDVPHLLRARNELHPAFAFLSMEPLLGPVDLAGRAWLDHGRMGRDVALDWVITGGETDQGGHRARPSHPDWFRSLRDQCAAAGVPFHHKQNGEWGYPGPPRPGKIPETVFLKPDGRQYDPRVEGVQLPGDVVLTKWGKDRAGRLLDGVTHDARPALASQEQGGPGDG